MPPWHWTETARSWWCWAGGVGFPKMPYELTDLSRIERTFYDVNPKYFGMAADLPRPLVLACAEITERAEIELECALNPNLPFTLADHLNFAAERLRKGIEISTPLAYDVRHLYPKETELAKQARELLAREAGLKLPDSEVVNIALHLINAEAEASDMHSMMMTLKALSDVDGIVEKQLAITLNKESFSYSRFSMHLRYLIQRLASCRQVEERISGMLAQMRREYPRVYQCARAIADYFQATWNWQCNDEEIVYLMLHISRLQEKHEA